MNHDLTNMFYPWEKRKRRNKSDVLVLLVGILLVAFIISLALDVFVATPKVRAIETEVSVSDREVYEEWEGQTVEVCKKKLGV